VVRVEGVAPIESVERDQVWVVAEGRVVLVTRPIR
jgi:hypothetical protein